MDKSALASRISGVVANVEKVIFGKHHEVELALVALVCRGHILVEDVPGTGKTVLAKALARDRKSTRLNSSHANISYAVFCLNKQRPRQHRRRVHARPQPVQR